MNFRPKHRLLIRQALSAHQLDCLRLLRAEPPPDAGTARALRRDVIDAAEILAILENAAKADREETA